MTFLEKTKIQAKTIQTATSKDEEADPAWIERRCFEIIMAFSDVEVFAYTPGSSEIGGRPELKFDFDEIIDYELKSLVKNGKILPTEAEKTKKMFAEIDARAPMVSNIVSFVDAVGKEVVTEVVMINIFDSEGKPVHTVGIFKDITEGRLLEQNKRLYDLVVPNGAATYEVNFNSDKFISGHEELIDLFALPVSDGYSRIMEQFVQKIVHHEDRAPTAKIFAAHNILQQYRNGIRRIVVQYRRPIKTADYAWVESTIHLFQDDESGDIRGLICAQDITEQKTEELELIHRSEHDMLTDLYNKTILQQTVDNFLQSDSGKCGTHACYIVDIDHFKLVNDNFGHSFGDVVISQIAEKLREILPTGIIGRIGGDEFFALEQNVVDEIDACERAQQICSSLHEEYVHSGERYGVSASVGVALYPGDGACYEELYKLSDTALYVAKANGRNRFSLYNREMGTVEENFAMQNRAPDDDVSFFDAKPFHQNVVEYVFRILYESNNKENAINSVLELVGRYYNVSRAYVFENSPDNLLLTNTYEWCNDGIEPQMNFLQNVTYKSLGNYRENFNEDGIFVMGDIDKCEYGVREVLGPQKVKSMLQFSISRDGIFSGFVGFDQCKFRRTPSSREVGDLRNVANLIGVFIAEMYSMRVSHENEKVAMSIVNGLDSYAYVCDPKTYEVLFINDQTKSLAPNARIGDLCYRAFWDSGAPCEECPMNGILKKDIQRNTIEMYNYNLNVWIRASASWIKWLDDKDVCLVDSVDITKYKN